MPATLFGQCANRSRFFVGVERKGRKAQRKKKSQEEPFIKKYLSHFRWFTWFDEGRNPDVTGMVKKTKIMRLWS